MALTVGSRLGHYDVTALIGEGGMGQVYQATDTKLGRQVALKILPEAFASDPDRLARFQREAQVLASLNHPGIAAIYGIEEQDDTRALVLELVEGPTLADRIAKGPIPVDEALPIAKQIAEALEAAHEAGVIHRDLKPANIKVREDGAVKVLDFGLAKAMAGVGGDPSASPTVTAAATAAGVILGTAAYMSPEQARGKAVDKRADVWAFGAVLYETLAGLRPFKGRDVSETLGAVLQTEPDWKALARDTPPHLKVLLKRCLEKEPRQRVHDIADVRLAMEGAFETRVDSTTDDAPLSQVTGWRQLLPWVAAIALAAALMGWMVRPAPSPDQRAVVRFDYDLPEGQELRNLGRPALALSSDGRHFVYNTTQGFYLRSLDGLEARLVPGTDSNLGNPFFSPDGEWIGYFSVRDSQLKKIPVTGGPPVTLSDLGRTFGATWETDGTILVAEARGIMRVSDNGGSPELVVAATGREQMHGPQLLPDGQTVLFTVTESEGENRWDEASIVAQSLDTGEREVVMAGGSDARYLSTGHLVYALGDVLYGVPFDVDRLEVTGGPVPLVEGVRRAYLPQVNTATANYGFSELGTLVYLRRFESPFRDAVLAFADRNGGVEPLGVPPGQYSSPRVSPDGTRVAVQVRDASDLSDVWVYDLTRDSALRRLSSGGANVRPVWTPDSERIAFASDRDGAMSIYWQRADGSGVAERLTTAKEGEIHFPESWSPDGRTLSFVVVGADWGLWTVSLDDEAEPELFRDGQNNQFGSAFSPDGKWIAYTDTSEVIGTFVEPFPSTGVRFQVAQDGETWPVWSGDGTELFVRRSVDLQSTAELLSMEISTEGQFSFGNTRPLPLQGTIAVQNYRDYDITHDGQQILIVYPADATQVAIPLRPRIEIVLNWDQELLDRVPNP